MISPDDPRLTAHADGLLPPEEAVRFEKEMAADPAARDELERLRVLQRELREAFAEETAEAEVARDKPALNEKPGGGRLWFPSWIGPLLAAACLVIISGALIIPTVGKVRDSSRRSVAASNLRQIGQACLIYASENQGRLPEAKDIWDFARLLAQRGGLNDGTLWFAGSESAENGIGVSTVLNRDGSGLDPVFARSQPAYAAVLSGLREDEPGTTPIAWTRGLRADGTWAPDSPYRGEGGYIVFLGGNVAFYRTVRDQLARHDGNGPTGNILEALPPGARIGDPTPSLRENSPP